MPENIFGLPTGKVDLDFGFEKQKKKRVKLTPSQRLYIWEHPKLYGRTCNICHQRIMRMSELELDHTRAHSKGGKKLALAHRDCNRMKGSKTLNYVQKRLGIKISKKKKSNKRKIKKKRKQDIFGIPEVKVPKIDFGI